jgi:uncharacterized membrane protein YoaK (UPF0700 family)
LQLAMRTRDVLLILLALTTGATDATAFERLGHVFASVITGNLILLGVSAAHGDGRLALFAGCALVGYALGVIAAAPRHARQHAAGGWPPSATAALRFELALLAILALGWELSGGRPGETAQVLLVALASAAMGVQSTAVRRIGQISTTYLTSTLTGLFEDLVIRRRSESQPRSIGILAMALVGAAAATGLIIKAHVLLPLLQLVPLTTVVLVSRGLKTPGLEGS